MHVLKRRLQQSQAFSGKLDIIRYSYASFEDVLHSSWNLALDSVVHVHLPILGSGYANCCLHKSSTLHSLWPILPINYVILQTHALCQLHPHTPWRPDFNG